MLEAGAERPPQELVGSQPASPPGSTPAVPRQRALMLAMLTLIYALNYLDRQIVVILQEPIKREYHLQDWQLGLLTGASISILYTAMGIPIARWIDRGVHRVRLIAAITVIWSVMTVLCGYTRSFGQFVIARMGVGLAEAGFTPAAHSMLSDLYPLRKRPAAMGVFAIGVSLGIMGGLSVGGIIAQRYDWRTALFVCGLPGILIALLFGLIAREPVRGATEADPAATAEERLSFSEAIAVLWRRKAYVHITLGSAATSFALAAMYAWFPSFLIRVHGMSLAEAGLGLGLLIGATGFIGTLLGGWQAARLGRQGLQGMLWAPIGGILLSIPLFVVALTVGSGMSTLGLLALPLILTGLWTAPAIALTQSLAPVRARATASAIYIVASNLIGVSLGPIASGLMSDIFARWTGSEATGLRWALIVSAMLLTWGVVHWALAAWALRREGPQGAIMPAAA